MLQKLLGTNSRNEMRAPDIYDLAQKILTEVDEGEDTLLGKKFPKHGLEIRCISSGGPRKTVQIEGLYCYLEIQMTPTTVYDSDGEHQETIYDTRHPVNTKELKAKLEKVAGTYEPTLPERIGIR